MRLCFRCIVSRADSTVRSHPTAFPRSKTAPFSFFLLWPRLGRIKAKLAAQMEQGAVICLQVRLL